ncbi:MAG: cell division protein FtsQ/DivIB [Beijerinckiaceae bacterium]
MDGGRRLLQTVKAMGGLFQDAQADAPARPKAAPRRRARPSARTAWARASRFVTRRGFGTALALMLVMATGAYGSLQGGAYETFVRENGSLGNLLARGAGFGIAAITITGQRELISTEVLAAAGISKQDSLLFLDAQKVRANLLRVPVIQSADVRKLYPNQLVIAIVERRAKAVWQREGEIAIVAEDGRPIDKMRDQRYARLPFVVGEGANTRLSEYMDILAAAGPLHTKIRAGTLVGQRRWTIRFTDGLDLLLPEEQPAKAMAKFAAMVQTYKLLDKDLLVADMRVPGRFIARLSADAVQKRDAKNAASRKKKGAPA